MAQGVSSRFRTALDTVASLVMLVAAIVLIGTTLWPKVPQPRNVGGSRPIALPEGPVDVSGDTFLGESSAGLLVLAFTDFQCPFCARFARDTLPRINAEYISAGKVRIAYRHLPLEEIHPFALGAAVMAECAGDQEHFWEAHDFLFESPTHLSPEAWRGWINRMKLDARRFDACRDGRGLEKVRRNMADAAEWGVRVTPTFFLGRVRDDGQLVVESRLDGAVPFSEFDRVLGEILGRGD